ncbi:TetR/AcrR family transcriptional regulator [Paenibacillus sp.]|uniref:TetR/AcrR family transcriptional regulator n=1 Tax=Paenibacillus sp. TaxID=58172 RepID=UPI002810BB49|nr:TetR/AcrR family transcriptional regulator [Paenibacillus sp.]
MPKVSDAYKEKKRADILRHALACFGEKGFQTATIDDIALRSGMSKGAIYGYFESKEEMYIRLMESGTEEMFRMLRNDFAGLPAVDKLRTLIRHYRNQELTSEWVGAGRVHMEFWIHSARNEDVKRVMVGRYERFVALVEEIVEEGKREGVFGDVNAREMSDLFWAAADGIFLRITVLDRQELYEKLWDDAEEMFLRTLSRNGDGAAL